MNTEKLIIVLRKKLAKVLKKNEKPCFKAAFLKASIPTCLETNLNKDRFQARTRERTATLQLFKWARIKA